MAICTTYNDDTVYEDFPQNKRTCSDKKCCCNCTHLTHAYEHKSEKDSYDRDNFGKGGCFEGGHYLCSQPDKPLIYFGTEKHGICPLYKVNEKVFEMFEYEKDFKPEIFK